MTVRESRRSA